ncbi:MAG: hypothetical protein WCG83_02460 [Candidatus Peregrinibacteria bacterium]
MSDSPEMAGKPADNPVERETIRSLADAKKEAEYHFQELIEELKKRYKDIDDLKAKNGMVSFRYKDRAMEARLIRGSEFSELRIEGNIIDCSAKPITVHTFETIVKNAVLAIDQIAPYSVKNGKITSVLLRSEDGYRFGCTLPYDGKDQEFVVTPHDAYRIKEPFGYLFTEEDERKCDILKERAKTLRKERAVMNPPDFSFLPEWYRRPAHTGWEIKAGEHIRECTREIERLEQKKNIRLLIHSGGVVVKEEMKPQEKGEIVRTCTDGEAEITEKCVLDRNSIPYLRSREKREKASKKSSETLYDVRGSEQRLTSTEGEKRTEDYFIDGKAVMRRYLEMGNFWFDPKRTHFAFVQEDGSVEYRSPFTGLLEASAAAEKAIKDLDDNRISSNGDYKTYEKNLSDLIEGQRKQLRPIAERAADGMIALLKTPQEYDLFEELYMLPALPEEWDRDGFQPINYMKYVMLERMRKHGEKLHGIDGMVEIWRAQREGAPHNSTFAFENRAYDAHYNEKILSMKVIGEKLPILLRELDVLPPSLYQTMPGIRYIPLKDISGKHSDGAGGFYSMADNQIFLANTDSATVRHEYAHHVTIASHAFQASSGINEWGNRPSDKAQDWKRQFHGKQSRYTENWKHENFSQDDGLVFAQQYGMWNATEDQATTWESFSTEYRNVDFTKRSGEGTVLGLKIQKVNRLYYLASLGRWDAGAVAELTSGRLERRGRQYWEEREQRGDFQTPECQRLKAMVECFEFMKSREVVVKSLEDAKEYAALIDIFQIAIEGMQEGKTYHPLALTFFEGYPEGRHPQGNPYFFGFYDALRSYCSKDAGNNPSVMTRMFEKRLELLPEIDQEPSHYDDLITRYHSEGNVDKVLETYARAERAFPRDTTFLHTEAEFLSKLRKTETDSIRKQAFLQQEKSARERIYNVTHDIDHLHELAAIDWGEGKIDVAIARYEPLFHSSGNILSFIRSLPNQQSAAHLALREYFLGHPEERKALKGYQISCLRSEEGKDFIADLYRALVEKYPDDSNVAVLQAVCYQALGEPERALEVSEKVNIELLDNDVIQEYAELYAQIAKTDGVTPELRTQYLARVMAARRVIFEREPTIHHGYNYVEVCPPEKALEAAKEVVGQPSCKQEFEKYVEADKSLKANTLFWLNERLVHNRGTPEFNQIFDYSSLLRRLDSEKQNKSKD